MDMKQIIQSRWLTVAVVLFWIKLFFSAQQPDDFVVTLFAWLVLILTVSVFLLRRHYQNKESLELAQRSSSSTGPSATERSRSPMRMREERQKPVVQAPAPVYALPQPEPEKKRERKMPILEEDPFTIAGNELFVIQQSASGEEKTKIIQERKALRIAKQIEERNSRESYEERIKILNLALEGVARAKKRLKARGKRHEVELLERLEAELAATLARQREMTRAKA